MTKILWELSIVCTIFRFLSLKSSVQGICTYVRMFNSCSVASSVVLVCVYTVSQKCVLQDLLVHTLE